MRIQAFLFMFFFSMVLLSGCGVVETVFKAGMWWAFFLVAVVIVVILWVAAKARK